MQSRKQALIMTADKFEDLELFYPLFRLIEAGWHVDVAAPKKKGIGGEHGHSIEPSLTFDEVVNCCSNLRDRRLIVPNHTRQGT